jgi:hypothetical protein
MPELHLDRPTPELDQARLRPGLRSRVRRARRIPIDVLDLAPRAPEHAGLDAATIDTLDHPRPDESSETRSTTPRSVAVSLPDVSRPE